MRQLRNVSIIVCVAGLLWSVGSAAAQQSDRPAASNPRQAPDDLRQEMRRRVEQHIEQRFLQRGESESDAQPERAPGAMERHEGAPRAGRRSQPDSAQPEPPRRGEPSFAPQPGAPMPRGEVFRRQRGDEADAPQRAQRDSREPQTGRPAPNHNEVRAIIDEVLADPEFRRQIHQMIRERVEHRMHGHAGQGRPGAPRQGPDADAHRDDRGPDGHGARPQTDRPIQRGPDRDRPESHFNPRDLNQRNFNHDARRQRQDGAPGRPAQPSPDARSQFDPGAPRAQTEDAPRARVVAPPMPQRRAAPPEAPGSDRAPTPRRRPPADPD